jgi:hypothetical protein
MRSGSRSSRSFRHRVDRDSPDDRPPPYVRPTRRALSVLGAQASRLLSLPVLLLPADVAEQLAGDLAPQHAIGLQVELPVQLVAVLVRGNSGFDAA